MHDWRRLTSLEAFSRSTRASLASSVPHKLNRTPVIHWYIHTYNHIFTHIYIYIDIHIDMHNIQLQYPMFCQVNTPLRMSLVAWVQHDRQALLLMLFELSLPDNVFSILWLSTFCYYVALQRHATLIQANNWHPKWRWWSLMNFELSSCHVFLIASGKPRQPFFLLAGFLFGFLLRRWWKGRHFSCSMTLPSWPKSACTKVTRRRTIFFASLDHLQTFWHSLKRWFLYKKTCSCCLPIFAFQFAQSNIQKYPKTLKSATLCPGLSWRSGAPSVLDHAFARTRWRHSSSPALFDVVRPVPLLSWRSLFRFMFLAFECVYCIWVTISESGVHLFLD